jgi:large subunit ribosomal protein L25
MNQIKIKSIQKDNYKNNIIRNIHNHTPCILYGNGINIKFCLDSENLAIVTSNIQTFNIMHIIINNKEYQTIIKEIQFHPVSDKILHIDFYNFNLTKQITVNIPIKIIGRCIGVAKGGTLITSIKKIKIKGLIKNLPKIIQINVSNLDIGDKFLIKDLNNEHYIIINHKSTIIASVKQPKTNIKSDTKEENNTSNDIKQKK